MPVSTRRACMESVLCSFCSFQCTPDVHLLFTQCTFSEQREQALSHWDQNLSQPGLLMGLYNPRFSPRRVPAGIDRVKSMPYRRKLLPSGKKNKQQSLSIFGSASYALYHTSPSAMRSHAHLMGFAPHTRDQSVRSAHSMTELS